MADIALIAVGVLTAALWIFSTPSPSTRPRGVPRAYFYWDRYVFRVCCLLGMGFVVESVFRPLS